MQREKEIMEAISLSRRDGTGLRAQVESLALYKSVDSSASTKKWKAIYMGRSR